MIVDANIAMAVTLWNVFAARHDCRLFGEAPHVLGKKWRVVGEQNELVTPLTGGIFMLNQLFRLGDIEMCAINRNWKINNFACSLKRIVQPTLMS